MNCENEKCKQCIYLNFSCKKCKKSYCSNFCKKKHVNQEHKDNTKLNCEDDNDNNDNNDNNVNTMNNKSPFIIEGQLNKEKNNDKYFSLENLDFVKDGKKKKVLGSGAFGDVFLIKSKIDGKLFAMKKMEKSKIAEIGVNVKVIQREIETHKKLIHPNIVTLYSFNEDHQSFYLIMEFMNNGTLFNVIKKNKGLSESEAFKFFIQAVAAVHFIHKHKLVHRDIKPENLLLDDRDVLKLCDFGWCADLKKGNRVTFCGTYEYMAPEIIRETPYDYGIDIWSLGILLYELLHGYSPFRAKNLQMNEEEECIEIFRNIRKFNFKIDKDVSNECKDILKKLLSPKNSDRIKVEEIFYHPWVKSFEKDINTLFPHLKIKRKNRADYKEELSRSTIIKDNTSKKLNILTTDENSELFTEVLSRIQHTNREKKKRSSLNQTIIDHINTSIETELNKHSLLCASTLKEYEKTKINNKESIIHEIEEMDNHLDKHLNDLNQIKNKTQELNDVIGEYRRRNTKEMNNKEKNKDINDDEFENISKVSLYKTSSQKENMMIDQNILTNNNHFNEKSKKSFNNKERIKTKTKSKKAKKGDFNEDIYFYEPRYSSRYTINEFKTSQDGELEFFPSEKNVDEKNFNEDKLNALEILEKANEIKEIQEQRSNPPKGALSKFMSFFNPFKCG